MSKSESYNIVREDISSVENQVFDGGVLKVMPSSFYKSLDENKVKLLMWKHGIYVLPTKELVDWLKENIIGGAIEIGAGVGTIGRALKIPTTDSRMQERPEIKMMYSLSNQPTINYPYDVEKLNAEEAIIKYKPDTVIGCFITHKYEEKIGSGNALGVQEEFILENVGRYINIGNLHTHRDKPILKNNPIAYNFDWLITRSNDQSINRIWIYDKKQQNGGQ